MPLQINEIMYDFKTGSDDGREWIEIFNNSTESVDLTNYKFFEADTNHKLKLIDGVIKLAPGGYAVIAEDATKFKTEWPGFSGTIFDSSFSLSNDGDALALKNVDNIVDSFTYNGSMGGAGDGKSLQKINGSWVGAKPTPGAENKITYVPPPAPKPVVQPKVVQKSESVSSIQEQNISETKEQILSVDSHSNPDVPLAANATYVAESTSFYFPSIALIVLVSLSAVAVYFIRRKPVAVEDFDILEE